MQVSVGNADGFVPAPAGTEVKLVPLKATLRADGSVQWRTVATAAALLSLTDSSGRAEFDWLRTEPYRVSAVVPTADPTCAFSDSQAVLDSAGSIELELWEACE